MSDKRIHLTIHAVRRALDNDLDPGDIEKIIREGQRVSEGRNKARYVLRTKRGLLIAICRESQNQIVVITVTRRR